MNKRLLIFGILVGFTIGIFAGVFVPKFWRTNADAANEKSLYGIEDKQAEAEIIAPYNVEHRNLEK